MFSAKEKTPLDTGVLPPNEDTLFHDSSTLRKLGYVPVDELKTKDPDVVCITDSNGGVWCIPQE